MKKQCYSKKIHLEKIDEKKLVKDRKSNQTVIVTVPMHYFYLCANQEKTFLCKQRSYRGVENYFRKDLPLESIYRHKWSRDKMVDHLMSHLPRCLKDAERYAAEMAL